MNISSPLRSGGVVHLSVRGEIDMATAGEFGSVVLEAVTGGDTVEVVVDIAGVMFCDSSGIAVLDKVYGEAVRCNAVVRLVNLQPAVRRVLELTGMLDALTDARSAEGHDAATGS